jgi:hypothetical protein
MTDIHGMSIDEIRQNPPQALTSHVIDYMEGRMAQGIEGGNRKTAGHPSCS